MLLFARKPSADFILAAVCLVYAAVLYIGAQYIPPPFFDILGSAAVPIGCAVIIAILSLVLVFRSWNALEKDPVAGDGAGGFRKRNDLAAGIVLLSAGYAGVMDFGWLGFDWATALFVFLATALLGGPKKTVLIVGFLLASILGFGGYYLFTEIFFIDLPS